MSSGEVQQYPPVSGELLPASHAVMLGMSNLNLPSKMAVTACIETLRAFQAEVEGDRIGQDRIFPAGYELTPTRFLARDVRRNRLAPGDATSVHQTFPTAPIKRFLTDPNKSAAVWNAAFWGIMPEMRASIPLLSRMSDQLGGACMTVYANQRNEHGELYDFSELNGRAIGTQPGPEAVSALGSLHGPEGYNNYFESSRARGIQGLIVDYNHLARSGEALDDMLDSMSFLQVAAEAHVPIIGMHAAFGRTDNKHETDVERSQQELEAVLAGPGAIGRTAMGEVLEKAYTIRQQQWQSGDVQPSRLLYQLPQPLVIMEVTAAAVARYQEERDLKPGHAAFISMTRDMGQSLNDFFDRLPPPRAA